MEPESRYKFLLLDFGHPMNNKTTEVLINSLENVLALGTAFSRSVKGNRFGISVLNSNVAIFRTGVDLRKKYDLITTKLQDVLKSVNTNSRVTVQEYKCLLTKSIQDIFQEFQISLIEITVITKKTATVVADILKDITNRLGKVIPNIHANHKYKVVQILDTQQEKNHQILNKNSLIDCTSCSDNNYTLNCFFKDWLLIPQQQLRISFSEDPNFGIECDTDDCIINPVLLAREGTLDSFEEVCSTGLLSHSYGGSSKCIYTLKVVNRLPVDGLCPTLVFGIPRRVRATLSDGLSWAESQNNSKMFNELCRELKQTGQGLIARTVLPNEKNYLTTLHLLVSDGETLLLNNVSPEELYLPNLAKSSQPADFCKDAAYASVIKSCLKKIEYLDEYMPRNFSSGIYEHLKHYLARSGQSKNLQFEPNLKIFSERNEEEEVSKAPSRKRQVDESSVSGACEDRKKSQSMSSPKQLENIHPALLTPKAVEKYKKVRRAQKKNLELHYKVQ